MTTGLTVFEKNRYMRSFRELIELGKVNPQEAIDLLDENAHTPDGDPYPGSYAALYFAGMLRGVLLGTKKDHDLRIRILEAIGEHYKNDGMIEWKVCDFMGPKRKYAKGAGM